MTKRIIEVAERAARLWLENRLLVVRDPDGGEHRVPIGEIKCVLLGTPAVSVTGALLAALAEAGVMVVISGADRLPVGMQLPLASHYLQNERFREQASASLPLCKRLWQRVVAAKIRSQARLLRELRGEDGGLIALAGRVRSGDPDNLEGRAAVLYWKQLFGRPFLRIREAGDSNVLLNYGYAVLRAMTARALCGAGLHPTLGIHHRNRYNAYCLADDLMEPYRCRVDRIVVLLNPENAPVSGISQEQRRRLLLGLLEPVKWHGEQHELPELLTIHARQLAASFTEKKNLLEFDG